MSNAVIYLNPEAYDTSKEHLMGRHSAGESFLKGFLNHGDVSRFYMWDVANKGQANLQPLIDSLRPGVEPVYLRREQRAAFSQVGAMHVPTPQIAREAWSRRPFGSTHYSITGITHTTATGRIMDAIADLIVAPLEPWDALICTSNAVRDSLTVQIEALRAHFSERMGATAVPQPRLEMIPLGINTDDFVQDPADGPRWRAKLGIPDDAIVVLYVGRLNYTSKMNPAPMAMALERAARLTKKPIHWVLSGWAASEVVAKNYHDETRSACPSVTYHVVDGREMDARRTIWSVADIFLSLSDNLQETFGLTPLEAMAAGIPVVVSDWNGYRDTVRHNRDGMRVSTYTPPAGKGGDFAYRHANEWDNYEIYVGGVSQTTVVDIDEAARAVATLANDPALRRRMGDNGRQRAKSAFDWKAIIPQYQALWADLNQRRQAGQAATTRASRQNPWRLDPFRMFAGYPTEWLTPSSMIALTPGEPWKNSEDLLKSPLVRYARAYLPSAQELDQIVSLLSRRPQQTVGQLLSGFADRNRHLFIERGVLLLAKYGRIIIFPSSNQFGEG